MLPRDLTPAQFRHYAPRARQLAVEHLTLLRQMPLAFLPSFLREIIAYDESFPAERAEVDRQLQFLSALSPAQLTDWFSAFSSLHLSAAQEALNWVDQPLAFTEQLSAYLWNTNQMEQFRAAATAYGNRMRAALAPAPSGLYRLGIAVIGQGASPPKAPLFQKLREHGTYFSRIDPAAGLTHLLAAVEGRAHAHPTPYGHWYVEGGTPLAHSTAITSVSYDNLAPARDNLLTRIEKEVSKPGMGPEELRTTLAQLSPTELGLHGDPILDRFQVRLLTEGSGTQIFSTTFAQWAAREVLRRAEALTLLVRFAPRQRQRPMHELLSASKGPVELDPDGSLIDGDMAAYYQWINQQRLPGSEQSVFLAWFEGQNQAVAIGPALPRGVESRSPFTLSGLLQSFGA